jgi:hypothetical protein
MALCLGGPQGGADPVRRGGETRFDTLSLACDMGGDVTTQSGQPPQATPAPLSRVGNGIVPANGMNDVELLERAASASLALREAIGARVVGQGGVIELMLVALLAQGHALIVGVPGLAKTLLVASLAEALDLSFGRVQFTPDLLPADITGTDVLHEEEEEGGGNIRRRIRFFCPAPSSKI